MRLILVAMLTLVALPALGQSRAFAPVVERLVHGVIVPAYDTFADEAARTQTDVAALCESPSKAALSSARQRFRTLVTAFAHIEPYRFGPAREANRYERLFFWPDRRGRGLRQVQGLLAQEDPSATDPERIKEKSVAVQGLPALEFALFGTGSDTLSEDAPSGAAGYRCAYARTVAGAIQSVGEAMAAQWHASFAQTMIGAGPQNALYRTHGEALQDILQAAATQMELAATQKLGAAIGDSPADANPKRAPLWRSQSTLPMIAANVDAVRALVGAGLADLLESEVLVRSTLFELGEVDRALAPLLDEGRDFLALASDPEAHRRLAFARIPLRAADRMIAGRIQGALGLAAGFNALDGD